MDYQEQIQKVNDTNPFMRHNGIRAVALTDTESRVEAEITADSLKSMAGVHGGLLFLMAEVAAGLVTRNDGRRYVTLDSSFRFLSGTNRAKTLLGEARLIKRGKTICFTHAAVKEPDTGKLLAEGDFTFYCLDA